MIREEHPRVNVHGLQFFFLPLLIHASLDQRPFHVGMCDQITVFSRSFGFTTTSSQVSPPSLVRHHVRSVDVVFLLSSDKKISALVVGGLVVLLLDQPVLNDRGGGAGGNGLLTLDLDGHGLVLLQAAGEVGLLGRLGGLGGGEGLDLADGVGLLDGSGLVGLELLQVQLLDEVGCDDG